MSGDCKDCGEKLTTCCLNCFEEQLDYKAPREAASLRQQRDALRDALADVEWIPDREQSFHYCPSCDKVQQVRAGVLTSDHETGCALAAALSQCERGDGEPQEPAP